MKQFQVYEGAGEYPYWVSLQNELVSGLNTRIVAPMRRLRDIGGSPIRKVEPIVEFLGLRYTVSLYMMSSVYNKDLGSVAGSLSPDCRDKILEGVDFLFTGF